MKENAAHTAQAWRLGSHFNLKVRTSLLRERRQKRHRPGANVAYAANPRSQVVLRLLAAPSAPMTRCDKEAVRRR